MTQLDRDEVVPGPQNVAPSWFDEAIASPYSTHQVEVEGCAINYLRWADEAPDQLRPGLVFVHGGGAHAHWWQFIAPFFRATHTAVALDLSGMGDSGHRPEYHSDQRAREVRAVIEDARLGRDTVVVGHSLGGFIGIRFAASYGAEVAGLVIVDSPVSAPGSPPLAPPPRLGPHRRYPTCEAALARFRVLPEQPCENRYLVEFIAKHSVVEDADGWRWKFDHQGMGPPDFGPAYRERLGNLGCRAALVYGEQSALFSTATARYMATLLGPDAPVVAVPQAHHHIMLDQPLAFVSVLRSLLAQWR